MKRSSLRARKPDTVAKDAAWSRAVLKRDGYLCQARFAGICTSTATHAHHVVARSQRPDLKHDTRVGVGLCASCHSHVHGNPEVARRRALIIPGWEADAWLNDRGWARP